MQHIELKRGSSPNYALSNYTYSITAKIKLVQQHLQTYMYLCYSEKVYFLIAGNFSVVKWIGQII
jgi:hypothetical protein